MRMHLLHLEELLAKEQVIDLICVSTVLQESAIAEVKPCCEEQTLERLEKRGGMFGCDRS